LKEGGVFDDESYLRFRTLAEYRNKWDADLRSETFEKRPVSKSALICPISALHSNFNPRNIQYIPVVKNLTRLDLERD